MKTKYEITDYISKVENADHATACMNLANKMFSNHETDISDLYDDIAYDRYKLVLKRKKVIEQGGLVWVEEYKSIDYAIDIYTAKLTFLDWLTEESRK